MHELPATRGPVDDGHFETLYEEHFALLVHVSRIKFRIAESEAETLAHDVLLAYLRKSDEVRDPRPWLLGAICHASRHYWRVNGQTIPVDPDHLDRMDPATERILDSLPDQLAAREALDRLSPRYQQILHMRFFQGHTVQEIAEHLGVTRKYAQKLIDKCLRRAEKLYGGKENG